MTLWSVIRVGFDSLPYESRCYTTPLFHGNYRDEKKNEIFRIPSIRWNSLEYIKIKDLFICGLISIIELFKN
jgi:hypothetical protein